MTALADASRARPGDAVTLGVRPEHLTAAAADGIDSRVTFAETLGHVTFAYADYAGAPLTVQLPGDRRPRVGDTLRLAIRPEQTHLFDAEGEAFARP